MAKKDFTETLDDVRRELDCKIESKVPVWVFTTFILIVVGVFGVEYSQLYNIAGRVSAIESTLNNSQHK